MLNMPRKDSWPHDAPGKMYFGRVVEIVGRWKYGSAWVSNDEVSGFRARVLLNTYLVTNGSAAFPDASPLDRWKNVRAAVAGDKSLSDWAERNEAVSECIRKWCAFSDLRAYVQSIDGSFKGDPLPPHVWNDRRHEAWFKAGGRLSFSEAFKALHFHGKDEDRIFWLFFSETDLLQLTHAVAEPVAELSPHARDRSPEEDAANATPAVGAQKPPRQRRKQDQVRVQPFLSQLFGAIVPAHQSLSDGALVDKVAKAMEKAGQTAPSRDTILRAAGRK